MTAAASLTRLDAPVPTRGLVLMLHGGTEHSHQAVDSRSASWKRMASMQHAITARAHEAGAGTWLLRYRERGWNGDGRTQIADARWALEEVRRAFGEVPVVLLGHSMGGRTSVHVSDDASVVGTVALAPWLPVGESVTALAGGRLQAAHGRSDKITSARATAAYVERARRVASSAELRDMGRVGHYMLRRVEAWNSYAVGQSLRLLSEA
ncbi:MAG: alpha/beta fold hydrolase [Nocardioides sp.]|nr:alpha/beta fold hydrolase [Nocardioides sp.]